MSTTKNISKHASSHGKALERVKAAGPSDGVLGGATKSTGTREVKL